MSKTDYQFGISVDTCFLDDQSVPEERRYVFAYTIHIRNEGQVPARLLAAEQDVHEVIPDTPLGQALMRVLAAVDHLGQGGAGIGVHIGHRASGLAGQAIDACAVARGCHDRLDRHGIFAVGHGSSD